MTMSSIKILEPTSARSNDELNGSTQNLSMTLIGSTLSNKGEINKKVSSFQKALDKISYQNESNGSGREISGSSISCVITLCKVLDNILLERQYNSKTRSIKLGNKLFRERVGSVPGGGKCCVIRCISHNSNDELWHIYASSIISMFSFFMCFCFHHRRALFSSNYRIDL